MFLPVVAGAKLSLFLHLGDFSFTGCSSLRCTYSGIGLIAFKKVDISGVMV